MSKPKVTIIGAGSYSFGRQAIWNMVTNKVLQGGILALVDTDATALDVMMKLAQRAIDATGVDTTLIGSTERNDVLADSDFVVLTFSFKNAHYRGLDTMISKKYGISMCSGDTIGPGGIFRALREVPEILRIAGDVENLCPNAWLINFVNPAAVLGAALKRYAPNVKSFALCDGNHLPSIDAHYMKLAQVLPEDFDIHSTVPKEMLNDFSYDISGVNHCTFLYKCSYKGEDRIPHIKDYIAKKAKEEIFLPPNPKAKPRYYFNYTKQLMDVYNAYPTAISHTKEYVPFFQAYGVSPNTPEPLLHFDAFNRMNEMAKKWEETEKLANGETPIEIFLKTPHGDHATDIIISMWGKNQQQFYINTTNGNAVSNMPEDAVLELRCEVDMSGPKPLVVSDIPRGILALQMQVLDTHELTVQAAVSCDKNILLRAMCTDPIINNIEDARHIMKELLELERDYLPREWYS